MLSVLQILHVAASIYFIKTHTSVRLSLAVPSVMDLIQLNFFLFL